MLWHANLYLFSLKLFCNLSHILLYTEVPSIQILTNQITDLPNQIEKILHFIDENDFMDCTTLLHMP